MREITLNTGHKLLISDSIVPYGMIEKVSLQKICGEFIWQKIDKNKKCQRLIALQKLSVPYKCVTYYDKRDCQGIVYTFIDFLVALRLIHNALKDFDLTKNPQLIEILFRHKLNYKILGYEVTQTLIECMPQKHHFNKWFKANDIANFSQEKKDCLADLALSLQDSQRALDLLVYMDL